MSDKRNWGDTVLGWFVERDERAARPGDESAAGAPSLPAPAAGAGSPALPVPPVAAGKVDFEAVFEAAGIEAEERQRVARARDLLASLPKETAVEVRRQIVEASLKAFGVPIEKILESAVAQIEALEGSRRAGEAETQQLLAASQERIRRLEQEIQDVRTVMEQRVAEQQALVAACNAKKLEIQGVLEFFGQEVVARVVRDSPRLHEPQAAPGA